MRLAGKASLLHHCTQWHGALRSGQGLRCPEQHQTHPHVDIAAVLLLLDESIAADPVIAVRLCLAILEVQGMDHAISIKPAHCFCCVTRRHIVSTFEHIDAADGNMLLLTSFRHCSIQELPNISHIGNWMETAHGHVYEKHTSDSRPTADAVDLGLCEGRCR